MRIVTFNVQHLRLRTNDHVARLDGARDTDDPRDGDGDTPELDHMDRRLTAQVIKQLDGDVVALQEVFDQETLDHFHDAILLPDGAQPYPHRICLPGNDGHGLDVAVMSRRVLADIASHAHLTPADLDLPALPGHASDERIFRRDCLRIQVGRLSIYVCHFKAPYPDTVTAWQVRQLEAAAVRRLIERDTAGDPGALWLVVGDLNEPGDLSDEAEAAIAPLQGAFSADLVVRMAREDRWSYQDPDSGRYSRPDAMLASPALAAQFPGAVPFFMRAGMEWDITRYTGPHLKGVGDHRPHASDHAALAIDLPGL